MPSGSTADMNLHLPGPSRQENKGVVELAQETLQANKEHLHALESYTQRLEAELERFDKLLVRRRLFFECHFWKK